MAASQPRGSKRLARVALATIIVTLMLGAGSFALWGEDPGSGARVQAAEAAEPADAAACGATAPVVPQRDEPLSIPRLTLPAKTDFEAVIYTSCGDMKIDLLEESAPKTVANFVALARQGFYDGLIWHQVSDNALIQTGDPNGHNGVAPDGPGYTIPDELPGQNFRYTYGTVGMANTGAEDSSSSQFFIVTHGYEGFISGDAPALDIEPTYSVFGRMRPRFIGSLQNIATQPVSSGTDALLGDRPQLPIYVEKVEIQAHRR